jgi:capsular exopolysaccharide synthesis family protein
LILTLVLFPLFVGLLLKMVTPLYKSEAQLLFRHSEIQQLFLKDVSNTLGTFTFLDADNAMASIEQIMQSKTVVGQVIKDMKLKDKNGDILSLDGFVDPSLLKLVRQKKGVDIECTPDTETFVITGYSTNPSEAKEISERITKAFLSALADRYKEEIFKAIKILDQRITEVRKLLNEKEKAVEEFRLKSKVYNTATEIDTLTNKLADLETSLSKLITELTPEHPDVKAAKNQIASLQRRLAEIPKKELQFNRLSREVDTLKTLYSTLITNREEAKGSIQLDLTNSFVYQPASLAENVAQNIHFPPRKMMGPVIIAMIFAVFFGSFMVFLVEYLDDSFWRVGELEGILGQTVLGTVSRKRKIKMGWARRPSEEEEVYNVLITARMSKGQDIGKIVALTSSARQEGKSRIAEAMARVLAQQGKKVVLIDANLRYPMLHKMLDIPNTIGLSNFLEENNDGDYTNLVKPSSLKNLDVITSGSHLLSNPPAYLDSDKFTLLVKMLSENYDFVLLDTPGLIHGSDVLILTNHADDVFCVVAQGETSRKNSDSFMNAMKISNTTMRGIIFNKVSKL